MRGYVRTLVLAIALAAAPEAAQKRRPLPKKPAPKAAEVQPKTTTPEVKCPSLIRMGVTTVRSFCDVPAGRDPNEGVVIAIPPHTGPATLTFDLHARHLYSADEIKRRKQV